ncbi:MAG: NIPSNAP family protein [Bacteroidota bacterium]
MIVCYLKYTIDPYKIKEFAIYAQKWIELVPRFGGNHLGYFLPHEGANDEAIALFGFPSLKAYEAYREASQTDPACQQAYDFAQ